MQREGIWLYEPPMLLPLFCCPHAIMAHCCCTVIFNNACGVGYPHKRIREDSPPSVNNGFCWFHRPQTLWGATVGTSNSMPIPAFLHAVSHGSCSFQWNFYRRASVIHPVWMSLFYLCRFPLSALAPLPAKPNQPKCKAQQMPPSRLMWKARRWADRIRPYRSSTAEIDWAMRCLDATAMATVSVES